MRIGIDLQVLDGEPRTGIGNYAYFLFEHLRKTKTEHEFVFFVPPSLNPSPQGGGKKKKIIPPPLVGEERWGGDVVVLPEKKIPFYDTHVRYAKIFQREKLDILHGVANTSPLALSLLRRGRGRDLKTVITLHDLAIYRHPEWFPRGQWLSTKVVVPRSIKKADRIIVPSETTKNDLIELFKVPEEKIRVIPLGVEQRFFANAQNDKKGGYILFVGTLEPRKNVARLIEAYEGLPEEIRQKYELWIAGKGTPLPHPPHKGEGMKRGSPLHWEGTKEEFLPPGGGGEEGGIRFLGYVPDEDLPALYQNAALFVYPSLYEGFGLPVLEAMAAGTPVVTSHQVAQNIVSSITNHGSTPSSPRPTALGRGSSPPYQGGERVGDNTRYEIRDTISTVDPYSVEEISSAMRSFLSRDIQDDARISEISARGVERAREFSWERTARETVRVYEEIGS